jgi:hypothetical protein
VVGHCCVRACLKLIVPKVDHVALGVGTAVAVNGQIRRAGEEDVPTHQPKLLAGIILGKLYGAGVDQVRRNQMVARSTSVVQ